MLFSLWEYGWQQPPSPSPSFLFSCSVVHALNARKLGGGLERMENNRISWSLAGGLWQGRGSPSASTAHGGQKDVF